MVEGEATDRYRCFLRGVRLGDALEDMNQISEDLIERATARLEGRDRDLVQLGVVGSPSAMNHLSGLPRLVEVPESARREADAILYEVRMAGQQCDWPADTLAATAKTADLLRDHLYGQSYSQQQADSDKLNLGDAFHIHELTGYLTAQVAAHTTEGK